MTLKNRAAVRTASNEDEATGFRLEFGAVRFGFHHRNDILNGLGEDEHADTVAQSETLLAGDLTDDRAQRPPKSEDQHHP
ncbi:MAG: hypothetical protein MUQ27_05215 [Acidimicrobiia bacterium]|nr:hypothetical protein [Acidimicrobiia bacterium]